MIETLAFILAGGRGQRYVICCCSNVEEASVCRFVTWGRLRIVES
jgi:hypothetical protein